VIIITPGKTALPFHQKNRHPKTTMSEKQALSFFETFTGKTADLFRALPQSGSSRKNFVAESAGKTYILTENGNLAENESFFYFSTIFTQLKLNTPKILSVSDDRTMYIQDFLGSKTLSELIHEEGLSENVKSLIRKSLLQLYTLQTRTKNVIDWSQTFEYESYNQLPITNDLFYFKSFIADVLEIPYHKSTLLKEFKVITKTIEDLQPKGLMIRDFQSRNIMVQQNDVYFIDYQSAMLGPLMYDVVSFLFQAKANFPGSFRDEMLNYYYGLWPDEETQLELKNATKPLQLIRFLQVLGAYGFRGLIQRKNHFIASMEQGIENLYQFAEQWDEMKNYPELHSVIRHLQSETIQHKIKEILAHQ